MSNELSVQYKGDIDTLSEKVVKSGLFGGVNTPEKAVSLMVLAQSQGLHPMKALQIYHLIQSRAKMPDGSFAAVVTPTLKADYVLAKFIEGGGTVDWTELSDEAVTGVFTPKGRKPLTLRWTIEMANKAGYTTTYENKPCNWQKRPRVMLSKRCITEALRLIDPGIFMGMDCEDEVELNDAPQPVATARATPQPKPESKSESKQSKVPDNLKKVSGTTIEPKPEPVATPAPIQPENQLNDIADEAASEIDAAFEISDIPQSPEPEKAPVQVQTQQPKPQPAPQKRAPTATVLPDQNTLTKQIAATQAKAGGGGMDDIRAINKEFCALAGMTAEDPRFTTIWKKHDLKNKPQNTLAYFQDLATELESTGKEFGDDAQRIISKYEGGGQ